MLLTAALAALLAGPLLYLIARHRPALLSLIDGFVLIGIGGLIFLDVLPDALNSGGPWVLAFAVLGLFGPTLLEHGLSRLRRKAHLLTLTLAMAGLVLHSVGDGAVLAHGDLHGAQDSGAVALALAIIIHTVPVGLMVWWLMYPVFGASWPALALLAMAGGKLLGYLYGSEVSLLLGSQGWAWFQALVAGSILHVVFGRPHLDDHGVAHAATRSDGATPTAGASAFEGAGNLAALAMLGLLTAMHLAEGGEQTGFAQRLYTLSAEAAPALLLAYLIGGFISHDLPEAWRRWISRGGSAKQALRGMAVGLPLPICSCGVLPLYRSLIQRGVPLPAALAFFVATPEVGLTALLVSLPMLGAELTLLRVGAAAVLAFVVGWGVSRLRIVPVAPAPEVKPCCQTKTACATPAATDHDHDHDHSHGHDHPSAHVGARRARVTRALRSGFVELVDDTMAWILAGLVLAAFVVPYAEQVMWAQLPAGLEVLLFAVLGIPIYVCAAGATPLVAVLIAAGVSPGAAIAFLLTGPATNVSTFGVLRQLHGAKLATAFGLVTGGGAILIGFVVDLLLPQIGVGIQAQSAHEHAPDALQIASLLALAAVFAASLLRKGGRQVLADLWQGHGKAA